MERDLTSGSVFQNVIYFSLPYFLSYFLQTLYGMADLFIVGQFDGCQYNSGFDWEPGDAYVDGDDRGACDGGYGFNRAVYWSGR